MPCVMITRTMHHTSGDLYALTPIWQSLAATVEQSIVKDECNDCQQSVQPVAVPDHGWVPTTKCADYH